MSVTTAAPPLPPSAQTLARHRGAGISEQRAVLQLPDPDLLASGALRSKIEETRELVARHGEAAQRYGELVAEREAVHAQDDREAVEKVMADEGFERRLIGHDRALDQASMKVLAIGAAIDSAVHELHALRVQDDGAAITPVVKRALSVAGKLDKTRTQIAELEGELASLAAVVSWSGATNLPAAFASVMADAERAQAARREIEMKRDEAERNELYRRELEERQRVVAESVAQEEQRVADEEQEIAARRGAQQKTLRGG